MSSYCFAGAALRFTGAALRAAAGVAGLPQKAESRVLAITPSTVPLLEVLARAVMLRFPSFEVKEYV